MELDVNKYFKDVVIDRTKEQTHRYWNVRTIETSEKKRKYDNYNILTFDIETWGLVPNNFALGIFYNGSKYDHIFCIDELYTYIENIENDTLIYAHNGMKYDFNLFIEKALSRLYKYEQKGEIGILEYINPKGKKIIFKDSLYILPGALKDLGKSFGGGEYKGITPQKFIKPSIIKDFNINEFRENQKEFNLKHLEEIDIEYCEQDCLVLWNILHNEDVRKLGYWNYNTIAKIANNKMFEEVKPIMIEDYYDSQFKNLYSGGLTDVFKHNAKGLIDTFDFNSMYPYAMTSYFGVPTKLQDFYYENKTTKYINDVFFEMLDNYPNGKSIVEIRLDDKTPNEVIEVLRKTPLIPNYKTNYNDIYDFRTYKIEVMNMELSNLRNKAIREYFHIKPISSIHCDKKDLFYPFKEFIESKYNERLANKKERPSYAQILKMIMNSSYGYFAMQNTKNDYWFGKDFELAFRIYKHLEEELGYEMEDIPTFKEFQDKNSDGYFDRNIGEFVYEIPSISDYIEYLKNYHIGDEEDFQIKNIEKILLDDTFMDYYICYWEGSKRLQKNKTSFYIASEITSKSRALLGKVALEIGLSGYGEVCYCDTDSLHIEVKNEEKLNEVMKEYLDENKLGYLKSEGQFKEGYWFAKKHYYLFEEIENKLVMTKEALKGFGKEKPIDVIIYERHILSVSKIASRLKRVSFDSNTFAKDKSFLNFSVSRKLNGDFLPCVTRFENEDNSIEINKHKAYLKKLYFEMIERGNLYIPREMKSKEVDLLTKELVEKRIKEINNNLIELIEIGLFDSEKALRLLPKNKEQELAREVLGLEDTHIRNRKNRISEIEKEKAYENKKQRVKNNRAKRKEEREQEKINVDKFLFS